MSGHFFAGAYGGDAQSVAPEARLECKICWHVYDPKEGCTYWQIAPGTPFSALPDHWTCPECDSAREGFLLMGD